MSASDLAISIRGLSKAYTIWHEPVKHSTRADHVLHRLRHPFFPVAHQSFWTIQKINPKARMGSEPP